jgi:predicted DNA-binding transcriptional regulator YafY
MPYIAKTHNRHQQILQILLDAGRHLTAKEVRERLADRGDRLSAEQVKRILEGFEALYDLDSRPRDTARGRPPTEYRLAPVKAPPGSVHVEAHQALTLQLAAELLSELLPHSLLEPLKVELKLAKALIEHEMPSMRRFPNKLVVLPRGMARPKTRVHSKSLATIYQALLTEKRLDVGYSAVYRGRRLPKRLLISPLGLICRFDTLYLVFVAEPLRDTDDPDRIFEWPVQRFSRVDPTDTPIRKPAGFELKKHARQPGFLRNFHDKRLNALGPEFQLKMKVREKTAPYLVERRFSEDQEISEPRRGWCTLTATVPNTRDLLSELYNFADDVVVIKPLPLREYLAERAQAVAAQYQPPTQRRTRRKSENAPSCEVSPPGLS